MNEASPSRDDDLTVVALGGNLAGPLGGVEATLRQALVRMEAYRLHPVRWSRWWRSAAWPDPNDPPFVNGVALVRTELEPQQVLDALLALQAEFGPRDGPPNSPRVLDLDLIASGRRVLNTPRLILPHPRAAERLFVMGPLAEIAPDWRHPVTGQTAQSLAERATVGRDARRIEAPDGN